MQKHFRELTAELRQEKYPLLGLVLLTLIIHGLLWQIWTPHLGPDGGAYLSYYLDLAHHADVPIKYTNLVYRLPIAPIVQILPLTISATVYQVTQTLFAVLSVICVYLIARIWNRPTATAAALIYLFNLPVQIQFHQVSVDSVYLWGLLLFCLALRYTMQNATYRAAIFLGAALGIVALTRPALPLLAISLVAIAILRIPLRQKGQMMLRAAGVMFLFVAPWISYKGLAYREWNYTRGSGWAVFYIVFSNPSIQEEIVRPDNGPRSEEFAALIEEHLLTEPVYQGYEITLEDFFDYRPEGRNFRFFQDAVALNDRFYGYESNNALLRDVSMEAIRAYPRQFVGIIRRGVSTVLLKPAPLPAVPAPPPAESAVRDSDETGNSTEAQATLPPPDEGELIPHSVYEWWELRPEHIPEPTPQDRRENETRYNALVKKLSTPGDQALGIAIMRLWDRLWFFTPKLFYLFTVIGLLMNRGKSLLYLLLINAAALVTLVISATLAPFVRYRLEVEPVFMISAAVGLVAVIQAIRAKQAADYF